MPLVAGLEWTCYAQGRGVCVQAWQLLEDLGYPAYDPNERALWSWALAPSEVGVLADFMESLGHAVYAGDLRRDSRRAQAFESWAPAAYVDSDPWAAQDD